MKLFKTIDEKLEEIGFVKTEEDEYGVEYERYNDKYKYTQAIHICHKASGNHIVQSYDKDLMDEKKIGNTCVGLKNYEMKLCIKKMKQLNRKWRNK